MTGPDDTTPPSEADDTLRPPALGLCTCGSQSCPYCWGTPVATDPPEHTCVGPCDCPVTRAEWARKTAGWL